MSRSVLVIGVPRSGTSCVAGVLHHLGVPMGERVIPANRWNPRGFFHDIDFEVAFAAGADAVRELIRRRKELPLWGLNTRRTADWIHLFPAPLVILTRRPHAASLESWKKMQGGGDLAAWDAKNRHAVAGLPTLVVDYDAIVDDPAGEVAKVAGFVGLVVTPEAVAFVTPDLRHH